MSSSRLDHPVPVQDYAGPSYWPTTYSPASPTSRSLASLSLDEDALSKQKRHSPAVNTVSNNDEKDCMRAKIALEYYNKENGTNYELACTLLSNGFKLDGNWVHCNFAAWQRNSDMNVTSPRKLFFAEMHGDDVTTWTVTACIVLEGSTTVGCSLCAEVIHPTHGFRQGRHKPKFSSQPTTYSPASYLPTSFQPTTYSPTQEQLKPLPRYTHLSPFLPSSPSLCEISYVKEPLVTFPTAEQVSNLYRKHAGIALEHYNKEKCANYKLVDVLGCNFISSGTWFHCNFTANPPNGDISSKLFFGEICLSTLTATACIVLEEGGNTTDGCYLCLDSNVIHPTHGFVKGLDKNEFNIDRNSQRRFMQEPIPEAYYNSIS